jgi:hypothetical protein
VCCRQTAPYSPAPDSDHVLWTRKRLNHRTCSKCDFTGSSIIDASRAYPTTFEDVRRSRLWQTRVMESLSLLERWYSAQCDGDWEHQYGVHIGTLDNPGWTLRIDLCGTDAEGRTLDRVKIERTENDWIYYWVEKNQFQARMGPQNLTEGIEAFVGWLEISS